jgi:hypothetical protein
MLCDPISSKGSIDPARKVSYVLWFGVIAVTDLAGRAPLDIICRASGEAGGVKNLLVIWAKKTSVRA